MSSGSWARGTRRRIQGERVDGRAERQTGARPRAAGPEFQCNDPLATVDEDLRIARWNEAAERLTGTRAEDALGAYCFDVLRASDELGEPICRPGCARIWLIGAPDPRRPAQRQSRRRRRRTSGRSRKSRPGPQRCRGTRSARHPARRHQSRRTRQRARCPLRRLVRPRRRAGRPASCCPAGRTACASPDRTGPRWPR